MAGREANLGVFDPPPKPSGPLDFALPRACRQGFSVLGPVVQRGRVKICAVGPHQRAFFKAWQGK